MIERCERDDHDRDQSKTTAARSGSLVRAAVRGVIYHTVRNSDPAHKAYDEAGRSGEE